LFDIANIRQQSEYARNIFTEYRNSLINPNKIKGLQVKKSLQQGNNCTTAQQKVSKTGLSRNEANGDKWDKVGTSGEGKGKKWGRGYR
jgi:hypothetical protein